MLNNSVCLKNCECPFLPAQVCMSSYEYLCCFREQTGQSQAWAAWGIIFLLPSPLIHGSCEMKWSIVLSDLYYHFPLWDPGMDFPCVWCESPDSALQPFAWSMQEGEQIADMEALEFKAEEICLQSSRTCSCLAAWHKNGLPWQISGVGQSNHKMYILLYMWSAFPSRVMQSNSTTEEYLAIRLTDSIQWWNKL